MCDQCSSRADNLRRYNQYNPAIETISGLLEGAESAFEGNDHEEASEIEAMLLTLKVLQRHLYGTARLVQTPDSEDLNA